MATDAILKTMKSDIARTRLAKTVTEVSFRTNYVITDPIEYFWDDLHLKLQNVR